MPRDATLLRRRPQLALVAGGLVVAGTVVAGTVAGLGLAGADSGAPPSPQAGTSAGPSSTVPAEPVVTDGCTVPGPDGAVALTVAQAEDLTGRAARLTRRGAPPADLVAPVVAAAHTSRPVATAVARSLMGRNGAAGLSCWSVRGTVSPEQPGRSGLTPRAARLRRAWVADFGALPAGGFAPGGVRSGHVDNSAHYEGRALDVFFRPTGSAAQRRSGWVFAQWVVAHAERFHVLSAIYADHIWTSWAGFAGWRDYVPPSGPTRNAVLRHLDHVHVAVESGKPFRAH